MYAVKASFDFIDWFWVKGDIDGSNYAIKDVDLNSATKFNSYGGALRFAMSVFYNCGLEVGVVKVNLNDYIKMCAMQEMSSRYVSD